MARTAYVCGPYRAAIGLSPEAAKMTRDTNIRNAEIVARALWKNGIATFCPHLNTANFDGLCNDELFLNFDIEALRILCNLIVVLPGWENSTGSRNEMLECLEEGYDILIIHNMNNAEKEIEEYAKSLHSE